MYPHWYRTYTIAPLTPELWRIGLFSPNMRVEGQNDQEEYRSSGVQEFRRILNLELS